MAAHGQITSIEIPTLSEVPEQLRPAYREAMAKAFEGWELLIHEEDDGTLKYVTATKGDRTFRIYLTPRGMELVDMDHAAH